MPQESLVVLINNSIHNSVFNSACHCNFFFLFLNFVSPKFLTALFKNRSNVIVNALLTLRQKSKNLS